MEIESKLKGAVKFSIGGNAEEVSFNQHNTANIEDKLAKAIIAKYPEMVWQKGKNQAKSEVSDKEIKDGVDLQIKSLENKIEYLNGIISEKGKEIKKAKGCEKVWRDKYEELAAKVDIIQKPKVEFSKESQDNKYTYDEDLIPFYNEMKAKNLKVLKNWLLENKIASSKEIDEVSDREDLIKFVLTEKREKFLA